MVNPYDWYIPEKMYYFYWHCDAWTKVVSYGRWLLNCVLLEFDIFILVKYSFTFIHWSSFHNEYQFRHWHCAEQTTGNKLHVESWVGCDFNMYNASLQFTHLQMLPPANTMLIKEFHTFHQNFIWLLMIPNMFHWSYMYDYWIRQKRYGMLFLSWVLT